VRPTSDLDGNTQTVEVAHDREYQELSYEQIAALLDCPPGTVMSGLARARRFVTCYWWLRPPKENGS
jgi:hypothetical protein